MGKSVTLSNGRQWATQKAAEDHFRSIRDRHAHGVVIEGATDHDDLMALLERYDDAHTDQDSKIGGGISYFEVRTNTENGGATRGFWVTRLDGTGDRRIDRGQHGQLVLG